MTTFVKKRSKKLGLPPGSPLYLGERPAGNARITAVRYSDEVLEEHPRAAVQALYEQLSNEKVTWFNVSEVSDVSAVEAIGKLFSFHPLVVEDIVSTAQRPKVEDYGEYLYIVLRVVWPPKNGLIPESEQVSIVLGKNYVISFEEGDQDFFRMVREALKNRPRMRKLKGDYLAYVLIDTVVDTLFATVEAVGERVEDLEERVVFAGAAPEVLEEIHELKRSMLFLRRAAWPLRELVSGLERGGHPLIQGETKLFLRDVYDHAVEIIDVIEVIRDMAGGLLEIYLTTVSNRTNETMKVLTVITTIFMPLSFIAGVYGMNFEFMPELKWRYGYPTVLAIMASILVTMLLFFRRRGWL
jgi:magnesium transporter